MAELFHSNKVVPYCFSAFCALLSLSLIKTELMVTLLAVTLTLALPLINFKKTFNDEKSLFYRLLILITCLMTLSVEEPTKVLICLTFLYVVRLSHMLKIERSEKLKRELVDFLLFVFLGVMVIVHSVYSLHSNASSFVLILALCVSATFAANKERTDVMYNLMSNLIAPLIFIKFLALYTLDFSSRGQLNETVLALVVLLFIVKVVKNYLFKPSMKNLDFIMQTNNFIIFIVAVLSNSLDVYQLWMLAVCNFLIFNLLNLKITYKPVRNILECLISILPLSALVFMDPFRINLLRTELGIGVIVVFGALVCMPSLIQINLVRGHHEKI